MNNNNVIRVGTFFSGIGSPEKALERLKREKVIDNYELKFFSEIDKYAVKSYCAIHNIDEKLNLGSITNIKGKDLPDSDLWIGGFPCQDISCAGKMKGFDFNTSTRSSLGWEMIRLLKEVKNKPKYVIFENVAMITSKRFKDTLSLFKKDLINLEYKLYDDILIASDYGIPQIRKMYFLIAILNNNNNNKEFNFPEKKELKTSFKDYLDSTVDNKYYLTNNDYKVLANGNMLFRKYNNSDILYEIDLKKVYNGGVCGVDLHSKFNQSSHVFSIFGNCPTLTANNTADNCKILVGKNMNLRIRKITALEAFRLMGFDDIDYLRAKVVCSESQLYHQAGNSIVVNVIYYILKNLL